MFYIAKEIGFLEASCNCVSLLFYHLGTSVFPMIKIIDRKDVIITKIGYESDSVISLFTLYPMARLCCTYGPAFPPLAMLTGSVA
jgi:hypothetical protein